MMEMLGGWEGEVSQARGRVLELCCTVGGQHWHDLPSSFISAVGTEQLHLLGKSACRLQHSSDRRGSVWPHLQLLSFDLIFLC